MKMIRFFQTLALTFMIVPTTFMSVCLAETKVITAETSYTMGDGESPTFAEAQVLQKAKQTALEQAGTYVEAYTKTQNYDLTTDEIQTLAGGVLAVDVLEKTRTLVGDGLRFYTKIKATVTTDKMEELAQRIRGKNVVEEYKKLQQEYARLSREMETWKQRAAGPAMNAERQTALERIKEGEQAFARVQENEATLFRRLEADASLLDRIGQMDAQGVIQALKDGANPNVVDNLDRSNRKKRSALDKLAMLAPYVGNRDEETAIVIANALFAHGAKLSNIYDDKILLSPISVGWGKFTELLIKNGATPRKKIEGQSPMEWAIYYKQPKVVEVLKTYGIPEIDTKKSALIRFIAAAANNHSAEMTDIASRDGIDINAKDDRGRTALIAALRQPIYDSEQYLTIGVLLMLGADPNVTGESGFTDLEGIPIHLAVAMNTDTLKKPHRDSRNLATRVIKMVLKHGARVAHRDSSGRTPLHIAAKDDNLVAAEILIAHGATIMPRDNSEKTPLDYAESTAMINFLKSHGAIELNK